MSYSWDTDLKAWTFQLEKMIKGGTKIQGPIRDSMNRPRDVKNMCTTTENCTHYDDAGGVKFNGFKKDDDENKDDNEKDEDAEDSDDNQTSRQK
jgi:hypothetical protein